jgi:uncharacterized protein (DUF1684 family)
VKRAFAIGLLVIACSRPEAPAPQATTATPAPAPPDHAQQVEEWKKNRDTRLRAEDGWLTLVGLHWLREGDNTFGSAKTNNVVMTAKAPASMGVLALQGGKVTLKPARAASLMIDGKRVAAPVELKADTDEGGPTSVKSGSLLFYVIKRGERYGIRVKDPENEARTNFKGMDYYPVDPKWRFEARFEPYTPVKQIPITDITGMTSQNPSPGALVFEVEGKTVRLDPILEGEDNLFIIFKDDTARDTTYPAGRYLYSKMPGPDGKVVVDFNKAYNPPCVFTDFATCPLPPRQNDLPVRIEAGEKRYAAAAH